MRVLLTGASGLLGRELKKQLQDYELTALSFSRQGEGLSICDLTNEVELQQMLDLVQPQFILHSAAERRPDVCEANPQAAAALNLVATRLLSRWAAQNNARLLFISTEYVFNGTDTPYAEDAEPDPLNAYGLAKLEGEKIVLGSSPSAMVLRVPVLYGPVEYWGESAVLDIFGKLQTTAKMIVDDWGVRYPTLTSDVAAAVAAITALLNSAEKPVDGGIYHFSGSESMTKYAMAEVMKDYAALDCEVQAAAGKPAGAPRPENAHLSCGRLQKLIGELPFTPFAEGLASSLQASGYRF